MMPAHAASQSYPYGGREFKRFVAESYAVANPKAPASSFAAFMDQGLHKMVGTGWNAWLARASKRVRSSKDKPAAEESLARDLHRTVKRLIPRFSLERGFEFAYAQSRGERQCLLQSVLIASMLQRCKIDAGVAMVWSNARGETSNLGHAVTLMRRSDGILMLVDASEPTPFAEHRGVFVRDASGGYRFLSATYQRDAVARLTGATSNIPLASSSVRFLDIPFLRSQFDYYRGERVPNGVLASQPDPQALRACERHLERSVRECPGNPLATYMLGRAQRLLGLDEASARSFKAARTLYLRYGWLPLGPDEASR